MDQAAAAKNTVSWTRATTIASTLSDRFGLEKWAQRNIILGIAAREDLYALAVSATPDDKDQLNRIAADAQEAAKSRSSANLGTALHRICERVDRGDDLDIPEVWRRDVDAYVTTLIDNELRINPDWIERVVVNPTLEVAGTFDRIVTRGTTNYLADIKTGEGAVTYGTGEIAIQLALYATSTHMWTGEADQVGRDRWGRYSLPHPMKTPAVYEPMPTVDTNTGLIIHLPVGTGQCRIYEVDLEAGYEAAKQAVWVREWRKRKFATELTRKETQPQLTVINDNDDW